jgi:hypothetical protein
LNRLKVSLFNNIQIGLAGPEYVLHILQEFSQTGDSDGGACSAVMPVP